jgi:hypothetical protein
MSVINFKSDGSEWYNYFKVRYDFGLGYYFALIGTCKNAFPDMYWRSTENMKLWIKEDSRWRQRLDEEFEKEVLK